jgi:TRAP-type C4-dicarboxylate transport system permease large subunit
MKKSNAAPINNRNANMPIYGRAYILTNEGEYIFGASASRTLRQQVEAIDTMWTDLSEEQKTSVQQMYADFVNVMKYWTLPNLKETLRLGWKGMLLPVIILLPFILDYLFKDNFFTARLGAAGAKYMSNSILLFIGGLASIYTCLIADDKSVVTIPNIAKMFGKGAKTIAPAIGVCVFGYMIGSMFAELNVAEEMGAIITGWNFGQFGTVVAICAITCFMGMVIPGSSLVVIFGPMFITTLVSVGCNPMLSAAMLPCICGVMCGITPPLGLGMYAGMTLAESDFDKTFKNNLWWVAAQFILEVVILMGWLPILGL